MSQFSQKYYKHFKIEPQTKKPTSQEEVFTFWVWSRQYRIFEIIVILLLLLILFCICNTSTKTTVIKEITPVVTTVSTVNSKQNIEKNTTVPKKTFTLEEKIPHLVLPDTHEIIPSGTVTLQDYMYFAYDTDSQYPNFIDPGTKRVIKEKKPKCATLDCPITKLSQQNRQAYLQWLETMTNKKLRIEETNDGFKIKETKQQ